jgi:antitoxin VapB
MAATREATTTAKLIMRGRYQYVVLPKGFEFKGEKVRVRKVEGGVVLEPFIFDVREWLDELERDPLSEDFMADGRNQPQFPAVRKQRTKGAKKQ